MVLIQLILSLLALFFIIRLLYSKNTPLFLMAGVLMQWLSVSIKVFYAVINRIPLKEVFSYYTSPNYIDTAFFLSMIGVVVYSVGLKIGLPSYYKNWNLNLVRREILRMDSKKVIMFYLIYTFVLLLLSRIRFIIPGINTGIFALSLIKWGVLAIAVLSVYFKRDNVRLFFVILAVEIVLSFVSYFSTFKEYLFIVIIIFASLEKRLFSIRKIIKYSFIGLLLFQMAIIWTAIKGEYRTYLSKGERVQKVEVDRSSALSRLFELSASYNSDDVDRATVYLVDRIGYINFFSLTIAYVPQRKPHENGDVWLNALSRIFMPRLLFPNKPIVDDSKHVNEYTGLGVAGAEQGASHSLGYMADSYIDFGAYGMFIPIFFLGMLTGYVYKYFLVRSYNYVWALVFTVPFYYLTNINGMDSVKVIGNLFIYIIVAFLFNRFLAPRINSYLVNRKDKSYLKTVFT